MLNRIIYWARHTFVPLMLILVCPPMAILMWYTNVALNGSILNLWNLFLSNGIFSTVWRIWSPVFFGSSTAWAMIAIFAAVQLFFMRFLPGKKFEGPLTPNGNTPVYKANGVPAFLLTLLMFFLATSVFNLFSATIIYDNFGSLIGALNIFSLCFCLFLMIKGRIAPSSSDSGSTGNLLFDYFWGTELYPRIFNFDVKMFTNCRFGMMSWSLIILSYAAKQQQLYGLSNAMTISVVLQLLYIAKFFIWEPGYMRSLDIMHDRAGYVICWGCLVWVPSIYASPAQYLVNHPYQFSAPAAWTLFVVGFLGILVNYLADLQRQKVRATNGKCTVWKKKPELIVAHYTTHQGDAKQTILLASGYWGLARHFHYLPELLAAFCWTLPALFLNVLPYFYFVFLTLLLVDRAFRHERRCASKYGKHWKTYCEKVPYKIIPFVY
jgi:7-dehydrocholesterol reductase